eukprot:403360399
MRQSPTPANHSTKFDLYSINQRDQFMQLPQNNLRPNPQYNSSDMRQQNDFIRIEVPSFRSQSNQKSTLRSYQSNSKQNQYDTLVKEPITIHKPFSDLRTEYNEHRTKKDYQTQPTVYSHDRQAKPQLFSYFFHDMEKEEREHVVPKKQEQKVCLPHSEPVIMYSLPYATFICQKCYDTYGDKSQCFALSDLEKPMEIMYSSLLQYIEFGREPKLQRQIAEHKAYLEQVKEDRFKFLTKYEQALIDKEITEILYDMQKFWRKIEEMQIQYRQLKNINDYETILLMYERWSSICYDFKDKYLNFDYIKNLVDKKIDPIMRPIALKVNVCYMCMKNPAVLSCNNIKDENCRTCKECANFCVQHGYYCRVHSAYKANIAADKSYMGNSCEMCKYDGISM